jgi:MFS family permease
MWLTVLILFSPIGVLVGYIIEAGFISFTDWRWGFYTQIMVMLPIIISVLVIPIKYIDLELASEKKRVAILSSEEKLAENNPTT